MKKSVYFIENMAFSYKENHFELSVEKLEIEPGTIVSMLGPNGSGKTTLLLLLGLIFPPQQGQIKVYGENPWTSREKVLKMRRELVLVPYPSYLFKGSVFNNLCFGLKIRGVPEKEWKNRVSEVLEMVDLSGFEKIPASELSSGEAQRLALARALIIKPRVLLFDEPTASVDSNRVSTIEGLITEVNQKQGTTIIFSTHNFSQGFRLADRVIYLSNGKITEYGHENYFSGKAETDGKISWLEPKKGVKIFFPGVYQGRITCAIKPNQIELLPYEQKEMISGLNLFFGRVTRLEMADNDIALIRVSGTLNFRVNLRIEDLAIKKISLSSEILVRFAPEVVEVIK